MQRRSAGGVDLGATEGCWGYLRSLGERAGECKARPQQVRYWRHIGKRSALGRAYQGHIQRWQGEGLGYGGGGEPALPAGQAAIAWGERGGGASELGERGASAAGQRGSVPSWMWVRALCRAA